MKGRGGREVGEREGIGRAVFEFTWYELEKQLEQWSGQVVGVVGGEHVQVVQEAVRARREGGGRVEGTQGSPVWWI